MDLSSYSEVGLAFVLMVQLFLFGFFSQKRIWRFMGLSLVESTVLSIACLVLLGAIMGFLGIPMVRTLGVCVLLATIAGAVEGLVLLITHRTESIGSRFIGEGSWILGYVMLFISSLSIFTWLMWPLVGLPTQHDGIAHTLFFSRILDFGNPILMNIPKNFSDSFGVEYYPYYPTGTHSACAIIFGWLVEMDIVSPPMLLKSALLTSFALLPCFLMQLYRRLKLTDTAVICCLTVLIAMGHYRFPYWSLDSGGFSRIMAQIMCFPILALFFSQALAPRTKAVALALIIPAAYMLHPSSWYQAVLLGAGYSVIEVSKILSKKTEGLKYIGAAWVTAVSLTLFLFMHSSENKQESLLAISEFSQNFDLTQALSRAREITIEFFAEYPSPVWPIKLWALIAGLLALPFLVKRTSAPGLIIYAVYIAPLISGLIYAFGSLPFKPLRLLVAIFFNQSGRLGETFYLSQTILYFAGVSGGVLFLAKLSQRLSYLVRARYIGLIIALLIVIRVGIGNLVDMDAHLSTWFTQYGSPYKSEYSAIIKEVKSKVDTDSILIYDQFEADIVSLATRHAGLFVYHECPVAGAGENCTHRKLFFANLWNKIEAAKAQDVPGKCLDDLKQFSKPAYLLLRQSSLETFPCIDGSIVATANGRILVRYIQDTARL
jgi:hypothetical protein